MNIVTLFVTIGLAYGVFSILLLVSERPRRGTPTALLAFGYALGSVGVLLQAGRGTVALGVAVLAGNLLAWLGLQWQAWAALAMSGRPTTFRLRVSVAAATIGLGIPVALLPTAPRAAFSLLVYSGCFTLAAVALSRWRDAPRPLRNTTAAILAVLGAMYGLRALAVLGGAAPPNTLVDQSSAATVAFYTVAFAAVVSSAFGLILLGKRAAEQSLAEAHSQNETILGTLTTGVAILDSGRIARVNPALTAMLGCLPADLEGQPTSVIFPTVESYERWQQDVTESLAHDGRHTGEVDLARSDGGTRWTWAQAAALDWQDGHDRLVVSVTDITTLRALQEELASRAATDDLTGLLNRRSFLERAPLELSRANRTLQPVCLAVIDLDRLKGINDAHGHAAGDQAIVTLARACRSVVRDLDIVARLSGDEFAVVLPGSTLAEAEAVMQRLLASLRTSTLAIDGRPVPVSASIGIAEYAAAESLETLLARADQAMYVAKDSGRGLIALQASL